MQNDWNNCKNILCIRADNMGDLLMSSPAIKALKETFCARITVLTSGMASGIARLIPVIDEVIVYNLPWVKLENTESEQGFGDIITLIKNQQFDAAVIFSVYSQNPLPAAMLAYLAGIPLRLAYCRENPYHLLTDWIPDKEPYTVIKHQVKRDLDLVASVGAFASNDDLSLSIPPDAELQIASKLKQSGISSTKPWLIAHAGVSEPKREYPFSYWTEACRQIISKLNYQILFTGGPSEKELTDELQMVTGEGSYSLAGYFSLEEFIALINIAPLLISVNTGSVHIAAATSTPQIVLYALTNPQHFPWRGIGRVYAFSVAAEKQSKNEVIRYVNQKLFTAKNLEPIAPAELFLAAEQILSGNVKNIPEMPDDWSGGIF